MPNVPKSDAVTRRRAQFPDVFAQPHVRAEVAGVILLIDEGLLPIRLIHQLFARRAVHLVEGVRRLDREALRDAYRMLHVEQPAIERALIKYLETIASDALHISTIDAACELVSAATALVEIARGWDGFAHGHDVSSS